MRMPLRAATALALVACAPHPAAQHFLTQLDDHAGQQRWVHAYNFSQAPDDRVSLLTLLADRGMATTTPLFTAAPLPVLSIQ